MAFFGDYCLGGAQVSYRHVWIHRLDEFVGGTDGSRSAD